MAENVNIHTKILIAKYELWRKRAIPFAEKLAERISALNHKFYPGCGFHYALEDSIVKTTHLLADPQPYTRDGLMMAFIIQIRLESDAAAVARAEEYVRIHG